MKDLINKIGKIEIIFFVLFPYIEILLFWLLSKLSLSFWIYLALVIILFFVYLILYGISIAYLFINNNEKSLIYNNLGIKLGYVPLQCALLLLAGGMGNPFLFLFMGIPLVFSAAFTIMTGILSNICFARIALMKKDKSKATIWKCLLSYIFGLDVIVAVIEFISMKKKNFIE